MAHEPVSHQEDLDRQRHLHEKPSGISVRPIWLDTYEKLVHEDAWGCSLGPPGYFCKDCWLQVDALYLQQHWEWHQKLGVAQNTKG